MQQISPNWFRVAISTTDHVLGKAFTVPRSIDRAEIGFTDLALKEYVQFMEVSYQSCTTLKSRASFYLSLDHRPCMSLGSFSIFVDGLVWWTLKLDFGSFIVWHGTELRLRNPLAVHACRPYKSLSCGGVAGYAGAAGDGDAHCPRCECIKLNGTSWLTVSVSFPNTLRK